MGIPNFSPLTNHFLLAMPSLQDSIFESSLTYIFEHSDEGAAGVVINKPLDFTLSDIFRQLDLPCSTDKADESVLVGGPVSPEQGFVLHRTGKWKSTMNVADNICISTSLDVLRSLASGGGPQEALIAVGYAGWAAGQLENEIANNAWLTLEADERIIFDTPLARRAAEAADQIGFDLSKLGSDCGHA